jgi:hypothetical protein
MNKMTGKTWVNVAVFEESNEAQVLEAFFKNKGIETRTYNDKLVFSYDEINGINVVNRIAPAEAQPNSVAATAPMTGY